MPRFARPIRPPVRPGAPLVAILLLTACGGKRPDDFAAFETGERLENPGQAPRRSLRVTVPSPEAIPYVLTVERSAPGGSVTGLLRSRVALGVSPRGEGSTGLQLRLLEVIRVLPRPAGGLADPPPEHAFLSGTMDGRGRLTDLEDVEGLPGPANLALLAPLLLPRFPDGVVGTGATWEVRARHQWSRRRAGDALTGTAPYRSDLQALLTIRYRLESLTGADRAVLSATARIRLRGKTEALSHRADFQGNGEATMKWQLGLPSGLPETTELTLKEDYSLDADLRRRKAAEKLTISLGRER
jgi:hypothetical protein